jgi:hypothetical protein
MSQVDRTPIRERTSVDPPEPREGLLLFDPEFPQDRWVVQGVARDGRIEAKRIDPADGVRTSWDSEGWRRAWERGYLKEPNRA